MQQAAHPRLHCRMVFFHSREAEEPVCESQVATDGDAEVSHLDLEGGREVRQTRLPCASIGICSLSLERGFHIEDDDMRGAVAHDAV
jgi:hypothetical protein